MGRHDYGVMAARYPMEFFHDLVAYVVMVSILFLFDRHVRAVQLESKPAQATGESWLGGCLMKWLPPPQPPRS
jgi:hypothetical protein